jgi:hypothetical protein
LNLKCDILVSKFAFTFNLYRYAKAAVKDDDVDDGNEDGGGNNGNSGNGGNKNGGGQRYGDDDDDEDDEMAVAALQAEAEEAENAKDGRVMIGLVGHPNVGKSSMVNYILVGPLYSCVQLCTAVEFSLPIAWFQKRLVW